MFQIVLSLMAGIFIGWNFHLFYAELDKIEGHPPQPQIISPPSPDQNLNKILKKEEDKIDYEPIQHTELAQEFNNSTEEPPSTDPSFQELLEKDNFSDAIAFYMEANEEELILYQGILEKYFKKHLKDSPLKIIEEIKHYIEMEPNSQSMQLYLANYYLDQKKLKEAISVFQNLHENFEDENYTIQLAKLYYQLEDYEQSNTLLQEINEDSIYHAKAQKLLDAINKKENALAHYTHQIPLNKVGSHYTIMLYINHTPLTLLLDTGASYTFVDEEKLPSLNIEKEILLDTAGGEIIAQLAHADTLQIEEIELKNFKVALGSFKREQADGLLGMNFFEQFDFKIDQKRQLLYLSLKDKI